MGLQWQDVGRKLGLKEYELDGMEQSSSCLPLTCQGMISLLYCKNSNSNEFLSKFKEVRNDVNVHEMLRALELIVLEATESTHLPLPKVAISTASTLPQNSLEYPNEHSRVQVQDLESLRTSDIGEEFITVGLSSTSRYERLTTSGAGAISQPCSSTTGCTTGPSGTPDARLSPDDEITLRQNSPGCLSKLEWATNPARFSQEEVSSLRSALLKYLRENDISCKRVIFNEGLVEILTITIDTEKLEMHLKRDKPIPYDKVCIKSADANPSIVLSGKLLTGDIISRDGMEETCSRIAIFAKDVLGGPYLVTTLHGLHEGRGQYKANGCNFSVTYEDEASCQRRYSFSSWCRGYNAAFSYSNSRQPTIIDIAAVRYPTDTSEECPVIDLINGQAIIFKHEVSEEDCGIGSEVRLARRRKYEGSHEPTAKIIDLDGHIQNGKIWCGGNIILKDSGPEPFAAKGDSGSLVFCEVKGRCIAVGLLYEMFMFGDDRRYTVMELAHGLKCLDEVLGLELKIHKVITGFKSSTVTEDEPRQ